MSNKTKKSEKSHRRWVMVIIALAFCISILMSFLSDLLLKNVNIIWMFIILILIILIGIIFDILGIAVTVADDKPFHSMASSRISGARSSLFLIRNASRVSNVCCDVIGDICGILSGTSGAYIVVQAAQLTPKFSDTAIFSIAMSGIVASLTIGGKAFGKDIAINHAKSIVTACGQIMAFFSERKN